MASSQSLHLRPAHGRQLSRAKERRRISMELPERFKVDEDEDEDAAQPDSAHPEAYVQQSMYGIIAAAHSKGSIGATFHQDSGSDTDTEVESGNRHVKDGSQKVSQESSARSSLDEKRERSQRPKSSRHRKNKTVESTILQPFSKLRSDTQHQDHMTRSQLLLPQDRVGGQMDRVGTAIRRDVPMLDRKIQARARADMESSMSANTLMSKEGAVEHRGKAPVALPEALAEIFQFEEPEEVISEYACWYLQSVLLQGYMYITQKHVCFYAYLQKKGNIIKSGHLSKQGKHNPRYKRYWFILRGDVFSYYLSAAEPYFPSGSVDLRYGISAELTPEKVRDKSTATTFTIATDKRTYYFRADSASSAKEWVRQLQKVIFRSHNEGDSVKISLPLENIVDVEPTSVIDHADTVKLRVIDNDETYAVDEYFFTFFSRGKDAFKDLDVMTQGNDAKKAALEQPEPEPPSQKMWTPAFRRSLSTDGVSRLSQAAAPPLPEAVRSTLSPMSAGGPSSPRLSGEQTRRSSADVSRTSFDRGRTSFDRGRQGESPAGSRSRSRYRLSKSPLSPHPKESSETYLAPPDQTSHGTMNDAETDMSASQVLTAPTLRMPQPRRTVSGSTVERLRSESRELGSGLPSMEGTPAPPLTRTQTDRTNYSSPTTLVHTPTELSSQQRFDNKGSRPNESSYTAARPLRAIATPLQHAFSLADTVRNQGKRISSYLSNSPKNYYEKFSGAIAGGKRHYSEADGLASDDRTRDAEEDNDTVEHERRFQEHFALPETERLRAVYYCWLHRVLPLYGKIYMSDRRFCFRSLLYGTRTKLIVPFRDIDNIEKEKGFRWGYPGMVLVIRGHEELFFDFGSQAVRDDCVVTVLRGLDIMKAALESIVLTEEEKLDAEEAAAENELLLDARKDNPGEEHTFPGDVGQQLAEGPPVLFDDPMASVLDFRPSTPMRITCLTIGSRGDVQPYIALCKGLMAHGHKVKIATHVVFEDWIRKHGIDFAPVEGDPAELMRLCVELGMFTPSFMLETSSFARGWLDQLLKTSWKACQNTDLLIESPSAMSGIHIAEALGIPYFRAFTMPWTKTRAYPHAFATPNQKMGGKYNYMTYVIFENIFWQLTAGQVNRWRRKTLQLKPTDLGKMQLNKVPFLYNFSPSVVVPPLDFSDWIRVTGYWFLDEANDWTPPEDLLAFIKKAREDNMKLVYVGFGSIPMSDVNTATRQIVDAVIRADVRCIFSKGWSDHFDRTDADAPELPPSIFQIRSAPHDWLFKHIDCAVHHGGAGTTGASLRAGLPTVIKPFFGDQFFFASRVEDLGVGLHVKKLTAHTLGKAIWLASHDERMQKKAHKLGEQIRQENGVQDAINAIYRDLEYAKSLIKKRDIQNDTVDEDDTEESWTFVENDSDADVTFVRRASGFSLYNQGNKRSSLGSRVLGGHS